MLNTRFKMGSKIINPKKTIVISATAQSEDLKNTRVINVENMVRPSLILGEKFKYLASASEFNPYSFSSSLLRFIFSKNLGACKIRKPSISTVRLSQSGNIQKWCNLKKCFKVWQSSTNVRILIPVMNKLLRTKHAFLNFDMSHLIKVIFCPSQPLSIARMKGELTIFLREVSK